MWCEYQDDDGMVHRKSSRKVLGVDDVADVEKVAEAKHKMKQTSSEESPGKESG